MDNIIRFYSARRSFGGFSNFYKSPMIIQDVSYPTVEHYYQSKKFDNPVYVQQIICAKTPMIAARLGRSTKYAIVPNWDEIKEDVMREALYNKFTQNNSLKRLLLETRDATLIEASDTDYYWGEGKDKSGLNRLGILLM